MKRLHLLRHARAARVGTLGDHERALAPKGIWAAEAMAERCARRLRAVDVALCSSAIRARETLRLFEHRLPPSCKIVLLDSLYLADSRASLAALRVVDDRCAEALLVGHEPGLSDLASALCGDAGRPKAKQMLAKGFKTASIATIALDIERWSELGPGTGRLRSLIRPKDLR